MMRFRFARFCYLLPFGLALLFAFQVSAIVPMHYFHGSESSSSSPEKKSVPEDCRCDFCLTFSGLDHATAVPPPVLGLYETAFAVVAAYASFIYTAPDNFSRARGPPVRAA